MSPGTKSSSSPDLSVMSRSDMRPPYASETKLTNPDGVHSTSIFQALRLLYWEYVTDRFISPHSMMIRVIGKCFLKFHGIHLSTCAREGKGKKSLSSFERKLIQDVNKRL